MIWEKNGGREYVGRVWVPSLDCRKYTWDVETSVLMESKKYSRAFFTTGHTFLKVWWVPEEFEFYGADSAADSFTVKLIFLLKCEKWNAI